MAGPGNRRYWASAVHAGVDPKAEHVGAPTQAPAAIQNKLTSKQKDPFETIPKVTICNNY